MSELPQTRFTRADDLDIAYQVVGPAAELDLVFVPGWVSHREVIWELPEFARFLDRLAAMGRLILFDKRGTGLSDRVAGVATLEQRADDIVAVMDAAGSARAAIAAWGEGAAIAVMFAATYPERVAALVPSAALLCGPTATCYRARRTRCGRPSTARSASPRIARRFTHRARQACGLRRYRFTKI